MSLASSAGTIARHAVVASSLFAVAMLGVQEVQAQFLRKWLSVGSLHQRYSESGGENVPGPTEHDLMFPGINHLGSHTSGQGNWFSVVNWTDETGETWPVKTVHAGPDAPGEGEVFPVQLTVISRFEPPTVLVDGFETFDKFVRNEEVDPTIPGDRMLHNIVNTAFGVTMERKIMQFSNEYHDNYHLIEHTFTNTGNVDGDEEIELPEQTIEGFYFFPIQNYADEEAGVARNYAGNRWGRNHMTDVIGDANEDYETDFRAIYSWLGYSPRLDYNMIGSPILFDNDPQVMEGDTMGRLSSHYFIGRVALHADRSADDSSDDPTQPATNTYFDWDRTELRAPRPFDRQQMQAIRQEWIEAGHVYPHHADLVTGVTAPWERDRFARQTNDAAQGLTGGFTTAQGFGPYTLEPGESIRIVVAEGFAGLSGEAALEIGKGYKRGWEQGDEFRPISYDANSDGTIDPESEVMSKQHWVMTSRDSVLQMFERARANFQSGYDVPAPPKPPQRFEVTSGVDRIMIEWELYDDVNQAAIAGYELYRGRLTARGTPENGYVYEKIAGVEDLPPDVMSFQDTAVSRGVPYYYYLQVVGLPSSNTGSAETPAGVALKSSRYWTQTYDPAVLVRNAGETLESARVVPNPLYLGSSNNVRWEDRDYRVGFLEIPGDCTISIYTEVGELVRRIRHDDGSGDEYWDLTTSSNQIIVSGIYLVVIEDHVTDEKLIRKLLVAR